MKRSSEKGRDVVSGRHATAHGGDDAEFLNILKDWIQGIAIRQGDKFVFVNQAFADLCGYESPEAVLALGSSFPLASESERERLSQYYAARIRGEDVPQLYEMRAVRKDGSVWWAENRVQAILWNGEPATMIAVNDITERREAEEILHRNEAKFRSLLEESVQGIAIRLGSRIVFANQAYARIFGFDSPEEIYGLVSVEGLVDPEDREFVRSILDSDSSGHDRVEKYEFRGRRKDGSAIWLENRIQGIEWEGRQASLTFLSDVSMRNRAEEASRESERRFRDLVEGSIQGVAVFLDNKPVFANEAMASILGYDDPGDILRLKSGDDFLHPREIERVASIRRARLGGGAAPDAYEVRAVRRDGSAIWLESRPTPVDWGSETAIQATYIDITDRKQSEEALRRLNDQLEQRVEERTRELSEKTNILEATFESISEGVALFDSDDRLVFCSRAYLKFFAPIVHLIKPGVQYETLVRATIEQGIADHPGESLEDKVRARLKRHRDPKDYFQIGLSDGRWLIVAERRTRDDGIVLVQTDITDAKRAEHELTVLNEELEERVIARTRELRREKEKAESYLEAANTMFLALDTMGIVTLVNQKLCEVLGYTEAELIGKDWHETCVPKVEAASRKTDYLARIANGGEGFVCNDGKEFRLLANNGKILTVTWHDSAIFGDDGELDGVLAAAEDVTAQLLNEIELRRAQRSKALTNLAGGIAHSLNNLLTPIVLISERLIHRIPENSEYRLPLSKILEAGNRAADLVSRILVFGRREDPQPIVCDIGILLRNTVDLLRQSVASTIRIDLEIRPPLEPVFADPAQIEIVIMNLVMNAAAAISGKTGHIKVSLDRHRVDSAHVDLAPADYARITVADDGPGIPSDVLENIFNPFFTTKNVGEGTGLGLSIADGVIRRHGGTLRVQSEVGVGTKFEFYLPLHDALKAA